MTYNREKYYLHRYGITLRDYNRLFEEQGGCCAICGKHQSQLNSRLCVDHTHDKSKRVRGLLCMGCNWRLGVYKDRADLLAKSAQYLEKYKNEIGVAEGGFNLVRNKD